MITGEIDDLRKQEYLRLKAEAEQSRENGKKDKILEIIELFKHELTQLLAIAVKLKEGDELYQSFGEIIQSFIEKFNDVGILSIGKIGEETEYDPVKHLPTSSAGPIGSILPGTRVVITMPGFYYVNEDNIEDVRLHARVKLAD